jgi:hypothetical protein
MGALCTGRARKGLEKGQDLGRGELKSQAPSTLIKERESGYLPLFLKAKMELQAPDMEREGWRS